MKLPIHLHILSKLRMVYLPLIPVYAFMAWMEETLPFITYLFPLPIIMPEEGAVKEPEAKKERKVMSLEKVELLDKSHRQ